MSVQLRHQPQQRTQHRLRFSHLTYRGIDSVKPVLTNVQSRQRRHMRFRFASEQEGGVCDVIAGDTAAVVAAADVAAGTGGAGSVGDGGPFVGQLWQPMVWCLFGGGCC